MTLKKKTIHGVAWAGISQGLQLAIRLGLIIVLAHLLTPVDFGLVAMVLVFTNFLMIFKDFGLTAAIIQRKEITTTQLSTVFWVNVIIGIVLVLITCSLAPYIATFYAESRLIDITIVLSIIFLISSVSFVQSALLTKSMDFKKLAVIKIFSLGVSSLLAVILAYWQYGVWCLVWQLVLVSLIETIMLWMSCDWRPGFLFRGREIKELLGFGANLIGFSFINYFIRNFDDLLIGRFLSPASLGFYFLAYRLLLFPVENITYVVARVTFPAFSMIQDEKKKISAAYVQVVRVIASLTFPLMTLVLIIAPELIGTFLGAQWHRTIFLVQIFALVGLVESIGALNGTIYYSQARTDLQFRVGAAFSVIYVSAFLIGIRWDVEGVAIGYATASLLVTYPSLIIVFRLIELKMNHFLDQLKPIFLAAALMGVVSFFIRYFLKSVLGWSDAWILVGVSFFSVIIYFSILVLFDKNYYREISQIIGHFQLKPDHE